MAGEGRKVLVDKKNRRSQILKIKRIRENNFCQESAKVTLAVRLRLWLFLGFDPVISRNIEKKKPFSAYV
jgi:hypothetical protein